MLLTHEVIYVMMAVFLCVCVLRVTCTLMQLSLKLTSLELLSRLTTSRKSLILHRLFKESVLGTHKMTLSGDYKITFVLFGLFPKTTVHCLERRLAVL